MHQSRRSSLNVLALACAIGLLVCTAPFAAPKRESPPAAGGQHLTRPKPALYFEQNLGQARKEFQYLARAPGYTVALKPDAVVIASRASPKPVEVRFSGASPSAALAAVDPLPGRSNYLIGRDASKWIRGARHYKQVVARGLYPGIDIVHYGDPERLEFDLRVAPNADPAQIELAVPASSRIDREGNLLLATDSNGPLLARPRAFQQIAGKAIPVAADFRIKSPGVVVLMLGAYDPTRELVIDPVLASSTYYGGSDTDDARDITLDRFSNLYVVGSTRSSDLPLLNATRFDPTGVDGYLLKMTPGGSILFATYIGGSGEDNINGVSVDQGDRIHIAGDTTSTDLPIENPVDGTLGGQRDGFMMKIRFDGQELLQSTYIGGSGSDRANDIVGFETGLAFVVGDTFSSNFPVGAANGTSIPQNTYGGNGDAFLLLLAPDATEFHFATYLGGSELDTGNGIAVDSQQTITIVGQTQSTNLPVTAGVIGPVRNGFSDGYVARIGGAGISFLGVSYLGGDGASENANSVAYDVNGNIVVTGSTDASNFPTTANAFSRTRSGPVFVTDAFLAVLSEDLDTLVYGTYLGGNNYDTAYDVAVGTGLDRSIVIVGDTLSTDFPQADALQPRTGGIDRLEGWIARFTPSGANYALNFSTYLGGSFDDTVVGVAFDRNTSDIAVAGHTSSLNFPLVNAPVQVLRGERDAFVARIGNVGTPPPVSTLQWSVATTEIVEGETALLTISRTGSSAGGAAVQIEGIAGSAQQGSDFPNVDSSIALVDGETSRTVPIQILADTVPEVTEKFTVRLFNASGAAVVGPQSTIEVTIVDDDAAIAVSDTLGAADDLTLPFAFTAINQTSTAEVTLTNTGTAPVTITAPAVANTPAPFRVQLDQCGGQTLAVNATCQFEVAFAPTAAGDFQNNIEIRSAAQLLANLTLTGLSGAGGISISVTKQADKTAVAAEDELTYTVRIANGGPLPATNLEFEDELPEGLELQSASVSPGPVAAGNAVRWNIPELGVGDASALTVTYKATVLEAPGFCRINSAGIVHADQTDSQPGNNSARHVAGLPGCADLAVADIVASGGAVDSTIQLRAIITNHGPATSLAANLRTLTTVDAFIPGNTGKVANFAIDALAPGETQQITWTADTDIDGSIVDYTGSIELLNGEDPDLQNNAFTDQTSVSATVFGRGSHCFIATAAYGSYLDPEVITLRHFRDEHLLTNAAGRAFVAWYYRRSPAVADYIRERPWLRAATRAGLTPIVYAVKYPAPTAGVLFVLAMLVVGRLRSRVRRARY